MLGAFLLVAGVIGTVVYPICGIPLLLLGVLLVVLSIWVGTRRPSAPPPQVYYVQQPVYYPPPYYPPPQQPAQVVTQKEVVTREIVKVRCRNCGALADAGVNNCPSCGAPMR